MQKLNPPEKNNKPALFSYEDLNSEKGVLDALKELARVFKAAGAKPMKLSGDSLNDVVGAALKGGRESGVKFKPLTLIFDDGQILQLRVKTTGDFYKVTLNKKLLPVKNQDNHNAAVKEIAAVVKAGSDKFTKAMAAKKVKDPSPKTTTSKKQQIAALTVTRDGLIEQIATVREGTAKLVEEAKKKVISPDGIGGASRTFINGSLPLSEIITPWNPRKRWSTPPQYESVNRENISKVFHVVGDIAQFSIDAGFSFQGKKSDSADASRLKVEQYNEAIKNGYKPKRVKISGGNTALIFIKDGEVLVNF